VEVSGASFLVQTYLGGGRPCPAVHCRRRRWSTRTSTDDVRGLSLIVGRTPDRRTRHTHADNANDITVASQKSFGPPNGSVMAERKRGIVFLNFSPS